MQIYQNSNWNQFNDMQRKLADTEPYFIHSRDHKTISDTL
jgi:hypothetical protein